MSGVLLLLLQLWKALATAYFLYFLTEFIKKIN